jgi:hypothetical protein
VAAHIAQLMVGGALILIGVLTATGWIAFGLFAVLFATTYVIRRVGEARLRR